MKNKSGKINVGMLIGVVVLLLIVCLVVYKVKDNKNNVEEFSQEDSYKNEILNEDKLKENESEKQNNIVLYNGLDISVEDLELSIKNTEENKKKYEITYYNYENGKFIGESEGKLEERYEGYAGVSNTNKIAISEKYDAIPRKSKKISEIPEKLIEFADANKVEIESIDLDGDGKEEYVMAYSSFASPEDYDVDEYTNYSEILVFDNNFKKIDTLVKSENQFWVDDENVVTNEFFCSLDDIEYIDIDKDGNMEMLVDTHVYEGIGVNIYKYENGKIYGKVDYSLAVLP